MKCCSNCFGDTYIEQNVFNLIDDNFGKCDYCGSTNVKLLEPSTLQDEFDQIIDLYEETRVGGLPLIECLRRDFLLFEGLKIDVANLLLTRIFSGRDFGNTTFEYRDDELVGSIGDWQRFRDELRVTNRFFLQTSIDISRISWLLSYVDCKVDNLSDVWFRARVVAPGEEFVLNDLGAPPRDKALPGRANPAGIPYLYLASDEHTAVSEVRPHSGEEVAIAEFHLPNELRVVDFRHPRRLMSPFEILSDDKIVSRGDFDLFDHFANELTKPVVPTTAAIEYLPTQYLCEFIKNENYDGVVYKSLNNGGMNIALFNPEVGVARSFHTKRVDRVYVWIN